MLNKRTPTALLLALLCLTGAVNAGPDHGHIIDYIDGRIAAEPERGDLYLRRAHLYAEIKHWRDAFADLDKAAALGLSIEARVARADFLSRRQQWRRALPVLDKVLADQPNHPGALLLKAKALEASNKPQAAMDSYLQLVQVKPDMGIGQYRKLAQLLAKHRGHDQAIALLDQRMAQVGAVPQLQGLAIELNIVAEQYSAAIDRMNSMAVFSRSSPKWQLEMAELHWAAGQRKQAEPFLASAKKLLAEGRQTKSSQRLQQRLEALQCRWHAQAGDGEGLEAECNTNSEPLL